MLSLSQPWQDSPKERNETRDLNLAQSLQSAEKALTEAVAVLSALRENVGSDYFWNAPNGNGVDRSLANGRGRVTAERVADAQRAVWRANEHLIATVSLASSYEVEEGEE